MLHRQFSSSPEFVQRFIEEARAANKIRHRGIIDIFGFGALPDGRQYYVMEMLEGMTLDAYLQSKGVLEAVEALPILRGVARAIDAAHAAGIVHRDLKPENVFLVLDEDQFPKTKVLDFGIAKLLGDRQGGTKATGVGAILGTPHYMSPEQCKGSDIDKAADVYAFGVMAFEVLTGRMPFQGTTAIELMMQHVGHDPPPPSTVNKNLSTKVDASILLMLSKDPKQRPASLAQAVEELARASGFTWQLTGPRSHSVPPLVRRISGQIAAQKALEAVAAPAPAPAIVVKSDTPTAKSRGYEGTDSVQAVGVTQVPAPDKPGMSKAVMALVALGIVGVVGAVGVVATRSPVTATTSLGVAAPSAPPAPSSAAIAVAPEVKPSATATAVPSVDGSAAAATASASGKPALAAPGARTPSAPPAIPAGSKASAKSHSRELPEDPY